MRSALLLSAVAVGSVAAINHKHASFHARRDAPAAYNVDNVDWDKALADFDWGTVDFSGGKNKPAAPPAPVATTAAQAQPSSTAEEGYPVQDPSSTKVQKPEKPSYKPTSGTPTKPAAPAKTSDLSDAIDDIIEDVTDLAESVGLGPGVNSKKPNGEMWLGHKGSDYQITFTNDASKDAGVICWNKMKMWNVKEGSLIFTKVKSGRSLTVSLADGMSGGCAPVFKNSSCSFSGIIDDSILEFTAHKGTLGAFQISREVTMHGVVMTATGVNGCTSGIKNNELSCIFGCADGASTCGTAGSYNIVKGADKSGKCNVGEYNGQPEGGCQFGEHTEDIQVTFSDDRNWPSTVIKKYSGEYAAKRR